MADEGPEFSIDTGEAVEVISESEAQQVFNQAQQWADATGSNLGELHPAQRPGFQVRILEGTVRLDMDRGTVHRAGTYERGERFKLFPMGSAVYAYADTVPFGSPDTRFVIDNIKAGLSYEETVESAPVSRGDDNPVSPVEQVFYPTGDDSQLVILAEAAGGPVQCAVTFEGDDEGEFGTPVNIVRDQGDNPGLEAADGEQIFVNMDLPFHDKVTVELTDGASGSNNISGYAITLR